MLQVTSAAPGGAFNQVVVTLSSAPLDNSAAVDPSNYAFTTRFGQDIPLYAKAVDVTGNVATVTLQDAMLDGGHYMVTVNGPQDPGDGSGMDPSANTATFEGVGLPPAAFAIKRHVPRWLNTAYGSTLGTILEATGVELDSWSGTGVNSAYTAVQEGLCLRTATGTDLAVIANNYGVRRPDFAVDDDTFRKLIPILATQRKSVLKILYDTMTALVGPKATAGWDIFEVEPNRFVIEIPSAFLSGVGAAALGAATYLHADSSVTADSTYAGDYLLQDATHADTEVGENPVILYLGVNNIVDVIDQIKAAGIEYTIYVS